MFFKDFQWISCVAPREADNSSFAAQLTALRRSGAKNCQGVEAEALRRLESFTFGEVTEVAHAPPGHVAGVEGW